MTVADTPLLDAPMRDASVLEIILEGEAVILTGATWMAMTRPRMTARAAGSTSETSRDDRQRAANGVVHGESPRDLPPCRILVIGGGINACRPHFSSPNAVCETSSSSSAAILGPVRPANPEPSFAATTRTCRRRDSRTRVCASFVTGMRRSAPARGFTSIGFVQVVAPEHEDRLRQNVADQQAVGIETRVVDREELQEIDPFLYTDDLTVAAYEPGSGFADERDVARVRSRRQGSRGSRVRRSAATSIQTTGGRVSGVETPLGTIATDTVLVATGSWADRLLAPLGSISACSRCAQVVVFRWPPQLEGCGHRVVIDAINHSWLRPEGIEHAHRRRAQRLHR